MNKGSIVYAGNKSILEDEKVLNNINFKEDIFNYIFFKTCKCNY